MTMILILMKLGSLMTWIGHPPIGHTGRKVSDDCPDHQRLAGRAFSGFRNARWRLGDWSGVGPPRSGADYYRHLMNAKRVVECEPLVLV